jgi:hypothetical protein
MVEIAPQLVTTADGRSWKLNSQAVLHNRTGSACLLRATLRPSRAMASREQGLDFGQHGLNARGALGNPVEIHAVSL